MIIIAVQNPRISRYSHGDCQRVNETTCQLRLGAIVSVILKLLGDAAHVPLRFGFNIFSIWTNHCLEALD